MEDSKIIQMIKDFFKDEEIDEETMKDILLEIKSKKIKSEKEIISFLQRLKQEMDNFIIDDSEFDE